VDAAGLRQFDSSALAVLLECRRLAEKSGRSFQLSGAPPRLSQLARLYGVAELLGFDSAQEAAAIA
jgi:phospholipid transport system transporter-binding protein